MPPELMGYEGRSVVVDPDVFCVSDVTPLVNREMRDKAIMARRRGANSAKNYASSVMLLDNTKLRTGRSRRALKRCSPSSATTLTGFDLKLESQHSIGALEPV